MSNKDKDKDKDKGKETKVRCRGRPKDKVEERGNRYKGCVKRKGKQRQVGGANPAY